MIASELVMYEFQLGYRSKLARLSLEAQILFVKIYVDDLNQGYQSLPYGSEYHNGKSYQPGIGWSGRAHNGKALTKEQMKEIETRAEQTNASEHTVVDREETLLLYSGT